MKKAIFTAANVMMILAILAIVAGGIYFVMKNNSKIPVRALFVESKSKRLVQQI
ncbi:hypothetical protein OXPF_10410 [Oxobacter pfennigii]|uniref:Uncharacterized protein n=1 Tax=Oxobacter pfennigii TaxID=36849 RepID=A0A0P8YDM5_9CLOT|nr:hypothetical protein [Oxobacter pfennigii]KPU45346.1 hypothetical protein OXPF_10410 [Oxobacter pfennigii]